MSNSNGLLNLYESVSEQLDAHVIAIHKIRMYLAYLEETQCLGFKAEHVARDIDDIVAKLDQCLAGEITLDEQLEPPEATV